MSYGNEPNPFDQIKSSLVDAMQSVGDDIRRQAGRTQPYDSQKLTPQQEELVWNNPVALYPDDVDPTTGVPLNNVQAVQKWYSEVTSNDKYPSKWVAMVDDYVNRKNRRTQGDSSNA